MTDRIKRIVSQFPKRKIDAFFVSHQPNVTYLTGFSGLSDHEREGYLVITPSRSYLFTFPTYYSLYKSHPFVTCLPITANVSISDHINRISSTHRITALGYEAEHTTVWEHDQLKTKLTIPLTDTLQFVEKLRSIKDPQETAHIQKAAQIADHAFKTILPLISASVTEKEMKHTLWDYLNRNADGPSFDPIVAFGPNTAIPHHFSSSRTLVPGDPILLDFGAVWKGYRSDMTRVVFWKTPSDSVLRVYSAVVAAQKSALSRLRGGIDGGVLDTSIRSSLKKEGFEPYTHGLGHGVGLSIHESPRLKASRPERIPVNSVVTVEPGIYLEGSFGIRIEDTVRVTAHSAIPLSRSPKQVIVL